MDQTFEKRKKVIYDFICDDLYVPMKIKEIALSKRGKYSKGKTERLKGIFQANPRGFGFITPENEGDDVFVPEENINGAFQGDEVEFIITGTPGGRRREGRVVRVLSHSVTHIVGLYEKNKNYGFVRPENQWTRLVVIKWWSS